MRRDPLSTLIGIASGLLSKLTNEQEGALKTGAIAMIIGTVISMITTSFLPAIAAMAGAVAGIITAHSAHRNQKINEQQALMNQYLGFIKSLQDEVIRLNAENAEQRIRLDHQDVEIAKLRSLASRINQQVQEIKGSS